MARYLTLGATGRLTVADNPATKYRLTGRGIIATTNLNLALVETANGRLSPAFISAVTGVTLRPRDAASIVWTDRTTSLVIANSDLTAGTYGPVVNGRYRISLGSLRSTIPGVPALKVTATAPITFYLSNFFGWGMDAPQQTAMVYLGAGHDARFEETLFLSSKPPAGYAGALPAHDVCSENGANLEGVNCESWGTRGTLVATFRPPSVSGLSGGGVRYSRWPKIGVDGRRVDASGNWNGQVLIADYLQLQNCANFPGNNSYIEDYICRNDPVTGEQYEDAVSNYGSYCAAGTVFECRRFLVENAMPFDPLFVQSGGTKATIGLDSSGNVLGSAQTGGVMGDFQGITGTTAATIAQGFVLKNGTVLTFANYGAAIQAGHDNGIDGVTAVSAGVIRSKAPAGYSRMAWTDGGGLHAWDRATNNDSSQWKNNYIRNSVVGHYVQNADGSRRSGYTPIWDNSAGGCTFSNNVQRPLPATIAAALAEVDAARAAQMAVWTAAGTVLGLTAAVPFVSLKISTDAA